MLVVGSLSLFNRLSTLLLSLHVSAQSVVQRQLKVSIHDLAVPLPLKSHQKLDVVPPACSFFTSRTNPFVLPRSARQPAGTFEWSNGCSTKVLSGWHKQYRTHSRTQAANRIREHNCHPGRRSKMLMWRIGALLLGPRLKGTQDTAERLACVRLRLRCYRAKPRS